MKRIILIGYMGAGKTTIGHQLAKRMGLMFYDLDWYIESRHRTTIPELFQTKGEEGFRKIEQAMLHEVAEFEDVVISCGGGTPCFSDNMDYINQQGETFYLKCEPDVLLKHLKMGKTERPLLTGKTDEELKIFIKEQLALREPYYNKAKHTIDVSLMDSSDKVKLSVEKILEIITATD